MNNSTTIGNLKYGDYFKLKDDSCFIYKIIRVHKTNVTVVEQVTGMVDVFSKSRKCYKEEFDYEKFKSENL